MRSLYRQKYGNSLTPVAKGCLIDSLQKIRCSSVFVVVGFESRHSLRGQTPFYADQSECGLRANPEIGGICT